ncbi:MAG: alpha/beta fold hydrolase [Pseudomonadota bacterium]
MTLIPLSTLGADHSRISLFMAPSMGDHARGLAVLLHGRNGAPDQPQIIEAVAALARHGFTVLVPALPCSAPNAAEDTAGGTADQFTMTQHYEDAARVLDWAGKGGAAALGAPPGPLLAVGHSMGAYAALRLGAERGAKAVGAVLAISAVVSGEAILAARAAMGPAALEALEREVPGAVAEYAGHDLGPLAPQLTQPTAFLTGTRDGLTRPGDVARFAELLPAPFVATIPDAEHCPSGPAYSVALDRALGTIAAVWPPVTPPNAS